MNKKTNKLIKTKIKGIIHNLIVSYLHSCGRAFHHGEYGVNGKYTVLMSDEEYHNYRRKYDCICDTDTQAKKRVTGKVTIYTRDQKVNIPEGYQLHYEKLLDLNLQEYPLGKGEIAVFNAPSVDIAVLWLTEGSSDDYGCIFGPSECIFSDNLINVYKLVKYED